MSAHAYPGAPQGACGFLVREGDEFTVYAFPGASLPEELAPLVRSAQEARALLADLPGLGQEVFVVLLLDAQRRLLSRKTVSQGTLTQTLVHPREVFAPAIEARAAAIIVAHNHPSGEVTPSVDDHEMTQRLCEAGELLGIPVLDHIIVGSHDRYYSFRANDRVGAARWGI